MIKKILIIVIILNIIIAGWFLRDFFKKIFFQSRETTITFNEEQNDSKKTKIESKTELNIETQKIEDQTIANGSIKSVNWDNENDLIYYNQNNFLKTDLNGSYKKTLSSYPFQDLKIIQCSKSGDFCLVLDDGFSVYSLKTKENRKLPEKTVDASLNYQGDGLIYLIKINEKKYQLASSDLFGENQILMGNLSGENLKIRINPKNNNIFYYSKEGISLVDLVDINQKNKLVEKNIIDADWSPDGKKILFSFYDKSVLSRRVQLGYYDLNQNKQFNLGLPGISQKCIWGKDSLVLYCAILASAKSQDFILDDWYSGDFISHDVFWKVDLLTSERKRLFDNSEKYPIVDSFDLFVKDQKLFFVDKISGNLIKRDIF